MSKLKKEEILSSEKTICEELYESILGPDEELDDELADEIMQTYNISEAELVEEFKNRLQADARRIYAETGKASDELTDAIRNVGKHQQNSAPEIIEPKTLIGGLLNGNLPSPTHSKVSYAFRKDGELTDNDKKILDDLTTKLENEE